MPHCALGFADMDLSGFGRARIQDISFSLLRGHKHVHMWIPSMSHSAAWFHGRGPDGHLMRDEFLGHIIKQASNLRQHMDLSVVDVTSPGSEFSLDRDEPFSHIPRLERQKSLHLPPVSNFNTFSEVVVSLDKFRKAVRRATAEKGTYELTNRKAFVVLVVTDDDSLAPLREDAAVFAAFMDLVNDSRFERLFPVLVTPDAAAVPKPFHLALHWGAFMGERNMRLAEKALWPEVDTSDYRISEVVAGVVRNQMYATLGRAHLTRTVESQWAVETNEQVVRERDAHERLLAVMDDGSF